MRRDLWAPRPRQDRFKGPEEGTRRVTAEMTCYLYIMTFPTVLGTKGGSKWGSSTPVFWPIYSGNLWGKFEYSILLYGQTAAPPVGVDEPHLEPSFVHVNVNAGPTTARHSHQHSVIQECHLISHTFVSLLAPFPSPLRTAQPTVTPCPSPFASPSLLNADPRNRDGLSYLPGVIM